MFNLLRNRAALVLLGLLVAGTVIGVLQKSALESGRPFLIQNAVRTVVSPASRVFHGVFAVGDQAVRVLRPRYAILRENARLRREVVRLSRENAMLREAAEQNVRLRAALGLVRSAPGKMIAAEIISRNASNWFETATIGRGSRSGISSAWAVVDQKGNLVGQVAAVDLFTSQITALSDPTSAVGAMVQRTRSAGILQGQGADHLVLAYLSKDADVKVKDLVVSSGMGQVIPKGCVIGRVARVVRNSTAGTTSAMVRPSVRLDQVEQVFVVKPGQGPMP